MSDLAALDAVAQAALVRAGEVAPVELVSAAIERIEQVDPAINSVIHRRYDHALEEARGVDRDAPFAGVPTLSKALNDSAGDPAHYGSAWVARSGRTAQRDAVVIARMRAAGFVVLGQTSTPEFGVLSVSESRVHGVTRNPWSLELTPGGSSGGAAAATASGLVPVAQGGDGGGSIRMPAAFCHLVGLKPTAGRISAGPGTPNRWSHSVPAVVSRTVRDTAAVLDAVSGPATGDSGAPLSLPDGGLAGRLHEPAPRLRIGVLDHAPDHAFQVTDEVRAAVRDVADTLADAGHHVVDGHPAAVMDPRTLPTFFDALSVTVVQTVDGLARQIGPPGPDDLDPVTKHWLRRGRELSGVELADALVWQGEFRARMAQWWADGFDLLLSPVLASRPKRVGWPWAEEDGIQKSVDVLTFTAPFNTTGQPAISVPAALTSDGVPLGVQLVAAHGREDLLVAVAAQLEQLRPWAGLRPPTFAA